MSDQPETSRPEPKLCPRCGTRLSAGARRCPVCGLEFEGEAEGMGTPRRGAEIRLSLPLAAALLAVFSLLSAGLTYAAVNFMGTAEEAPTATVTATVTLTPTASLTPQPTATFTPEPSPTPLTHIVSENETCAALAAFYGVSVQSIVQLNNLPITCPLSVGQRLLIPHPTATPSPEPTATLPPEEATRAACETITYTVEANDTLSGIAANYNVDMRAIMDYNGMSSETVFTGQVLIIPLCERLPTPGPTPTPTPPPPYPAPNPLLPMDGAVFTVEDDTVTLQWAAVGTLREDEFYHVVVVDVTEGSGTRRIDAYVTDTKYIVPSTFRPTDGLPHIMRWWVETARRTGTNSRGEPIYTPAGAASTPRTFSWAGTAVGPTPTP